MPPRPDSALEPRAAAGPDWIADAVRQALEELRAFAATSLAFAMHPSRFADEWYRGEKRGMNPLGMLATAAAIVLPVQELVITRVLKAPGDDSLLGQALGSLGPYLYYAALGALAHPVFRLAGSKRSLRGSVGVAIYAGILPGLGATLVVNTSLAFFMLLGHPTPATHAGDLAVTGPNGQSYLAPAYMLIIVLAVFVGFVSAACAGLAGLHRVRWWWALLGLIVGFVVTGFVFGELNPPGHYGLHLEAAIVKHQLALGLNI